MTQARIDLVNVFQEVTQTLAQNQQNLNQADEFNQDHGSNMVQTFTTITKAVQTQKKKGASDSTALGYAAKKLSSSSTSSSGQLYARNLSAAATQFKGKQVDQRGAMDLLMTLIGGGAAAQTTSQTPKPTSSGGDLLGGLVGTMMGGGSSQSQEPTTSGSGDMLSSLLGGLLGGGETTSQPSSTGGGDILSSLLGGALGGGASQTSQGDGKIGLDDILQAAMAYFQAKQSGQGNLQSIIQAVTAASRMGDTVHRQQSTEMVVNSFLQAVASNSKK